MRYRMEVLDDDELVIRNVETDIVLGTARCPCIDDPHNPDRAIIIGCNVFNKDGDRIAEISTKTVPNPIEMAPVAIANYEAHYGYPGLKDCAKSPDPRRIEWLLGTLLVDTASIIARAGIEYRNGGFKAETKSKCADLIAQLYRIWYASRFGSFDGERRVMDPYFANFGGGPRMSFAAAAQHYGMFKLRRRFPDVRETTLKEVLSWPLDLLGDTLNGPELRSAQNLHSVDSIVEAARAFVSGPDATVGLAIASANRGRTAGWQKLCGGAGACRSVSGS
jgi:hypothetical protein